MREEVWGGMSRDIRQEEGIDATKEKKITEPECGVNDPGSNNVMWWCVVTVDSAQLLMLKGKYPDFSI